MCILLFGKVVCGGEAFRTLSRGWTSVEEEGVDITSIELERLVGEGRIVSSYLKGDMKNGEG